MPKVIDIRNAKRAAPRRRMTLNEQGLSAMAKRIEELRELLRIEYSLRNRLESPWCCVEGDCPYLGKPTPKTGCACFLGNQRMHQDAVKRELKL